MKRLSRLLYSIMTAAFVILSVSSVPTFAAGDNVPRVVITGYEAKNGSLTPDESTEVVFHIKNESSTSAAYSVLIACTEDSNRVYAAYGQSNKAYIKSLAPGEAKDITLNLIVASKTDLSTINCKVGITYTYGADEEVNSIANVSFPVKEESLKIKRITVPQTTVVDTRTYMNIICENTTEEDAYDAIMKVTGTGIETQTFDLGTVLNGSRKSQEVYLNFDKTGSQEITVELSYKDAQGQVYTKSSQKYQIEVVKGDGTTTEDSSDSTDTSASIFTGKNMAYLAGFLLSAAGVVILIVRKKMKEVA